MTGEAARTNLSGLNFNKVWVTQPNDYPILAWQIDSEDATDGGGTTTPTVEVNVSESTVSPETVTPDETERYTISVVVDGISETSGEVDVRFEDFTIKQADDLTIDFTETNVTDDGTLVASGVVNATAPSTAGTYDVNVTDLRVENNSDDGLEYLIEDANISVAEIEVTTQEPAAPPSGGSGGSDSALASFDNTQPLKTTDVNPESLAGKIRVETGIADDGNTSVEVLRSSLTNYSIEISAPEKAENVTFYLQKQAISASQNIDLTMYLDSEKHQFEVTSTGPGKWVAFNVPHFSTRTVTFTTDGDRLVVDADGEEGNYTEIQPAVDNATDGDIVEVRPGTYEEQVTINKNISLVAPDGAVLNGTALGGKSGIVIPEGSPASPGVSGFTIRNYTNGVEADHTNGSWIVQNTEIILNRTGDGIEASGANGGWTVRNTTVDMRNDIGAAISADRTSGPWLIESTTVLNGSIISRESTGDWEVRNTTVTNSSTNGISAGESTGNWTIQNTTIENSTYWGIDARKSSGNWSVLGATIVRNDGGIDATNTSGTWEVHQSIIKQNTESGVLAFNSDPKGDATYNWWGESPPDDNDCVGNVTCTPALSSPPDETATISGTLKAESGASLESDQVALFADTGGNVLEIVNTDEIASDGSYQITGLQDRSYQLGYLDRGPTVDNGVPDLYALGEVSPPASQVNATLPTAYNRSIRVVDQSGDPIQGADAYVRHTNTSGGYVELVNGDATNSSGYVVVNDTSQFEFAGNLTFGARYHGADDQNSTTISGPRDRPITLSLALAQVSGRIKLPHGTNASGDIVVVNGVDAAPDFDTTTNDTGNFSVSVPTGAEYETIYAQRSGFDAPVDGVPDIYPINRTKVTADTSLGVVDLPAAKRLNVTVRNESGEPIPNASIHVEFIANDTDVEWTNETDSQGRLVVGDTVGFEGVGRIELSVEPPEGTAYTDAHREVTLDENRTVNVTLLQQVPIEGNVTTETGEPANGLVVGQPDDERARFNAVPTDPDNTFTLPLATNASYELGFRQINETAESYFPRDGVPDIAVFERLETGASGESIGTQELGVGHALNITVETPDGTPLADARVVVQSTDPERELSIGMDGRTNENGRFVPEPASTPGLEVNGSIRVDVETPDGSGFVGVSRTYTVTGDDPNRTIEVLSAMTVNGTIRKSDGTSTSVDRIRLDPVGPDEDRFSGETVFTNETGSFNASVAESGTYHVGFAQVDSADQYEATFPTDGVPDVYALANVSSPSEAALGTQTLPPADNLTVHVVGPDGNDVSDAKVHVGSINIANGARHYVSDTTNDQGNLTVEVNGTVNVYVEPGTSALQPNSTGQLTVTEDRTVAVRLDRSMYVNGTVLQPDGDPASAEKIRVDPVGYGAEGDTVFTDENGYFNASVSENGTYYVGFTQVAGVDQYEATFPTDGVPDVYALANISSPSEADLGKRTLPQAHNLTIKVVGPKGESVGNVPVDVGSLNLENNAEHWAEGQTNDTGVLTVEVNGSVDVYVDPERNDLQSNGTGSLNVDSDRTVTVQLDAAVPVTGYVEYANGDPASDYPIQLLDGEDFYDYTNDTGYFEVYPKPNVTYAVGFRQWDGEDSQPDFPKDGRPDLHLFEDVTPDDDGIDLGTKELPPAHLVNVSVETYSGEAIEGAEVYVSYRRNDSYLRHPATTNATGEVILEDASAPGIEVNGTIGINVESTDQYGGNETTFQIDSSRDVTVRVRERVDLTGSVTADGSALVNSTILAASVEEGDPFFNRTNETGAFRLGVEPNRTYSVRVVERNASTGEPGPQNGITDIYEARVVDVDATDRSIGPISVPDASGNLSVRVVNASGSGIADATVRVVPNQQGGAAAGGVPVPTGSDGFAANDSTGFEATGNYTLTVEPPEGTDYAVRDATKEVNITGDEQVTFTLEKRVVITGRVTANGTTMANSSVFANGEDGTVVGDRANETGHFRVEVEPNQRYSISVAQRNATTGALYPSDNVTDSYEALVVDVGTADESVGEVAVPNATGNLSVRVVNASGLGVENASLRVSPNQAGGPEIYPPAVSTGSDGYPPDLPDDVNGLDANGNYTIRVEPPENAGYVEKLYTKRNVSVVGEETIEVELTEATAQFSIDDIEQAPDEVTENTTISLDVSLTNTGSVEGTTTVTLFANESIASAESKEVTLAAGASTTVTLNATFEQAGDYELFAETDTDDGSAGIVSVVELTEPANVTLTNATVSPMSITEGESVIINATVQNTGDVEGNITLEFYSDGDLIQITEVNVSAASTRNVSVERAYPDSGDGQYNITVANQSEGGRSIDAGTVIVGDTETETGTGAPGFGIAPAILGLLGAALVFYRRR